MSAVREVIKRSLPSVARKALIAARDKLAPPPLEAIVLHDYQALVDPSPRPRFNLVLPSVNPAWAFGGVTTAIDVFLEIGRRTGVDLRIVLDDFGPVDRSVVDARAVRAGIEPSVIDILGRTAEVPPLEVRAGDVFMPQNWWTALNIRRVVAEQPQRFGGPIAPYVYIVQDYEPAFYPFSSTHMAARAALDPRQPAWAVFNTGELYGYVAAQGHKADRAYVFEPKLSDGLRPFLARAKPPKEKRILVYGRPQIPRNCYPALERALKAWTARFPEFADWEVVSAGLPHPPLPIGHGRAMRSLGKLSLDDYAQLLMTTGVGLSLMASPHPSYPPLEMAHFGVRTVTNTYANKDLGGSHQNIFSAPDIMPDTLADGLGQACRMVQDDPMAGWAAKSLRPSFLEPGPYAFLDELAADLKRLVWR